MASRLAAHSTLNHPYLPSSRFEDQPVYALLDLQPESDAEPTQRIPLNLALVVDASGSMFSFQLSDSDREYWMGLALSRDEMERGEADARDAVFWSGQTLQDMQSAVRRPMTLAVEAIKQLLTNLHHGDQVGVVAFADLPYTVFTPEDWNLDPEQCHGRLDALLEQRLPVDIGTGTRLSGALGLALDSIAQCTSATTINRIIVVSDGIVQDERETNEMLDSIQAQGLAITTIGLGEEFDEEFLMRVADGTRGDYYYAEDIEQVTSQLMQELVVIQSTAIRQLYVAVHGLNGTVVQDIYMARPNMSIFDEMDETEGWLRARVGDLAGDQTTGLLVQMAAPMLPDGEQALAEIQFSWKAMHAAGGTSQLLSLSAQITADYTTDETLIASIEPEVQELVDRFVIYKYEREGQRAQEKGDIERAKEKYGAVTRELRRIGEDDLAADVEEQIAALNTGTQDPTRAKRIKATTRRLGAGKAADDPVV